MNFGTVKEHVSGNVTFVKYRDGNLYYRTEAGLEFPVPVSDTGTATFLATDKALLFMRWIRAYLNLLKEEESGVGH